MDTVIETGAAAPLWRAIGRHLEGIRKPIFAELRNYPQPIAGCDQQFNHLSQQRDSIFGELERLDTIRNQRRAPGDEIAAVDAFIATSPFIDPAAARKIRFAET